VSVTNVGQADKIVNRPGPLSYSVCVVDERGQSVEKSETGIVVSAPPLVTNVSYAAGALRFNVDGPCTCTFNSVQQNVVGASLVTINTTPSSGLYDLVVFNANGSTTIKVPVCGVTMLPLMVSEIDYDWTEMRIADASTSDTNMKVSVYASDPNGGTINSIAWVVKRTSDSSVISIPGLSATLTASGKGCKSLLSMPITTAVAAAAGLVDKSTVLVQITVSSTSGASLVTSKYVTVNGNSNPQIQSPTAYPTSVATGRLFVLSANATHPQNNKLTASWSLAGPGTVTYGNGFCVIGRRTAAGTITATITVRDEHGAQTQASVQIN